MTRIHVAMLCQRYLPHLGGAERQLAALCPLLAERGITVTVITRRHAELPTYDVMDGVPVYRVPMGGTKAMASARYTVHALRLLGSVRPDILHAHELLSPTTTALMAKWRYGAPVVAKVLRGGRLGDVDKLRHRFGGPTRLAFMRRRVDRFIAISGEIQAELTGAGIPESQICRVPNGVDTEHFRPADARQRAVLRERLDIPRDDLIVVYTGRLVAEKGVDVLLASWEAVRRHVPSAALVVVGDGPEKSGLEQRAGAGVRFAGRLDDVCDHLRAADVFVLPSLTEGLSNALLEAMACGLPVVATRVGGAPDLISDGQNGCIVEPGNSAALSRALIELLPDTHRRRPLGEAAVQTVAAGFRLVDVADRLCDLYRDLHHNGHMLANR